MPENITIDLRTLENYSSLSDGQHIIKIISEDTTNYYRKSVKSSGVNYTKDSTPTPKEALSEYTWAEIKYISSLLVDSVIDIEKLSSIWNINLGDSTRSVEINGESHQYRLIGINHDEDVDGNTLGMTFEQIDAMADVCSIIDTDQQEMSSTDSWQSSNFKTTLEGFTVETDLSNVITPAKKLCANNVSIGTPTYYYVNTENGLFIESEIEVFGTSTNTIDTTNEGSQYDYYISGGSAEKTRSGNSTLWWLRSPNKFTSSSGTSFFVRVSSTGVVTTGRTTISNGVVPCFCI